MMGFCEGGNEPPGLEMYSGQSVPRICRCQIFLWGYLKSLVYYTLPRTIEELKRRIEDKIAGINEELLRKGSSLPGPPLKFFFTFVTIMYTSILELEFEYQLDSVYEAQKNWTCLNRINDAEVTYSVTPVYGAKRQFRWDVLDHSSYSPDLEPRDFHFFGPLKKYLGSKRFNTAVQRAVMTWLQGLDADYFYAFIDALVYRWKKVFGPAW
ncbi:hypothetical protein ANN_01725 [Periplaneta americana]|uniref:Uncharacterized protein n=1 Tax=Periplaneta americana TaxID=6978 RepID=A0ABQ8TXC7_PERAM|nr:hypothetical protein ANN_01725 [Periplaneta americana]